MLNRIETLFCLSFFITACVSSPTPGNGSTYDQRQTGDYNIHISLKDIRIVALLGGSLGGSEDYDYNYDYSEMTIKPSPGALNQTNSSSTTPSPTSTTIEEDTNTTTTTEKVVEITPPHPQSTTSKSPILLNNSSIDIGSINATDTKTNRTESPYVLKPTKRPANLNIPVQIVLTPVEIISDTAKPTETTKKPTTTVEPLTTTVKVKQANCIEGFVKDRHGNCRQRVRKPQQQSLLRKLIQLSQRAQPPKPK